MIAKVRRRAISSGREAMNLCGELLDYALYVAPPLDCQLRYVVIPAI
jgi:hypothetical protein